MRLNERRWIDLPRSEVFAFTSDFSNIADWDPGVATSVKVSDGPVGLGTEFDLEVRFGVTTTSMRYTITAFEPDTRVVLVGHGKSLDATDDIRFDTQDNMTRIDYTADLDFHNGLRFIAPLASSLLNRVGERALDGLVEQLSK